jgi:hypothetical protein
MKRDYPGENQQEGEGERRRYWGVKSIRLKRHRMDRWETADSNTQHRVYWGRNTDLE